MYISGKADSGIGNANVEISSKSQVVLCVLPIKTGKFCRFR